MATLAEVEKTIKEFEEDILYDPRSLKTKMGHSDAVKKILKYRPGIRYILGKYLQEEKTYEHIQEFPEELKKAWVELLRTVLKKYKIQNNIPKDATFETYSALFAQDYINVVDVYEMTKKKVGECTTAFENGQMSLQNSSHRQTAVSNLESFIEKAKELFEEDVVKKSQERIHFFQTA
jgi:hypothetical protein